MSSLGIFCPRTQSVWIQYRPMSKHLIEPPIVCHSHYQHGHYLTGYIVFDRRRRDPLWRITERLSGEDKSTQRAVDLFYAQIDALIAKRFDLIKDGYKPDPEAGVDLLDMFIQSTDDQYRLGGMVFAFLSAGRKSSREVNSTILTSTDFLRRHNRIHHLLADERDSTQ